MITIKSLPELKRERELVGYEMWGGRSTLGVEVQPFLGREVWADELDAEIERREWEEKYPEHAKLESIPEAERDAIGGFIEWLGGQRCEIGKHTDDDFIPLTADPEMWLADYFGINRLTLYKEEKQMHQELVRGG